MKLYIKIIKISKLRIKKRHFQLLEMMVAMFLLLVCVAPMLHIYTHLFKEQQAVIRSYQMDHLVHLIHAKITEQLYKRQIPLEELLQTKSNVLADIELKKALDPLGYGCTYAFTIVEPHTEQGKKKASQYLCSLVITMEDLLRNKAKVKNDNEKEDKLAYEYFVYIDLGAKDKKNQAPNPKQVTPIIDEEEEPELGADVIDESE